MSAKAILVLCAQALFVQSALSQCTSRAAVTADPEFIASPGLAAPYGMAAPGLAAPYGLAEPAWAAPCAWASPAMDFTPTSGGGLSVTSSSAIAPFGLSVISENAYEGILSVAGEVPFVGTTGVDGVVSSAGAGAVNHACGNGVNAMVSETAAFAPGYAGAAYAPTAAIAPAAAITPAVAIAPTAGIASGFAGPGLGYRAEWAGRSCGCTL